MSVNVYPTCEKEAHCVIFQWLPNGRANRFRAGRTLGTRLACWQGPNLANTINLPEDVEMQWQSRARRRLHGRMSVNLTFLSDI